MKPGKVFAMGGFDDLRSRDLRFLEEAARLGDLTVLLWSDEIIQKVSGAPPKLSLAERLYFLRAIRYVTTVIPIDVSVNMDELPAGNDAEIWADVDTCANLRREEFCQKRGIAYRVFGEKELREFPAPAVAASNPDAKKVIVTGSFDWFHSGHVRFLQEASQYGDLYVVVGHDANIRLLKGEGHPLLGQEERRYVVQSIKFVKQTFISSGNGWMDADPEIQQLRPDIYAVNEDGDRGGKREYCEKHGIQYLVLKRVPAEGLPSRTSTELRGF